MTRVPGPAAEIWPAPRGGPLKIEILTRDVEKKPEIITCLRSIKGFWTSSGKIMADGVEAELTGDYILLTVTVPWLADELVRTLFTVRPVPFAPSFYEIAGDPKVIVTCAARPVNRIIPVLETIDHLDLEAGELAGRFETEWTSRDVDVSASFEIVVQGGVALARVKFASRFRESEYHCRNVLARVGLTRGLALFSAEDRDFTKPAKVSPVALTAAATVDGETCAALLNRCPGKTSFLEAERQYRMDLPGEGNYLSITGDNNKSACVRVHLETPWVIDGRLIDLLGELLGIDRAEVSRTVTGLTLSPDDLLHRLGFAKEKEFLLFRAAVDGLEASYDIGRRDMMVRAVLPWSEAGKSRAAFDRIKEFTARVMKLAV